MKKRVLHWLKTKWGIILDVNQENFGMSDTPQMIIGKILHHYMRINDDQFLLLQETESAIDHFNYLNFALKQANVQAKEGDIVRFINGDKSTVLSFFQQLYMSLENVKIEQEQHEFTLQSLENAIDVDTDSALQLNEINPFCKPILDDWDLIFWYKDRLAAIKMKCEQNHEEYRKYLEEKHKKIQPLVLFNQAEQVEPEQSLKEFEEEDCDYTYEELMQLQYEGEQLSYVEPNRKEARKTLKKIRLKVLEHDRKLMRERLQNELLEQVWKKLDEDQQRALQALTIDKLHKKSDYEKEIERKLLDVKLQRETMLKNAKLQEEMRKKREDEEFVRSLLEENLDSLMDFIRRRDEKVALHQQLYREKLKAKALKHKRMCEDIYGDLVELAFKRIGYKKMYGVEPDEKLLESWAALFTKELPLSDLVVPLEKLKEEMPQDRELANQFIEEIKRQECLNLNEFQEYIHFIDNIDDIYFGLNVLGYIIHKLLVEKYPYEPPLPAKLALEVELAVCVSQIDLDVLEVLRKYLQNRAKVIIMEEAIGYCVEAFEREEADVTVKDEYLRLLESKTDKKGKKGKNVEESKKSSKSSKKVSEKKSGKGSKKDEKDKGKKGEDDILKIVYEEKENQTPRLFPCEKVYSTKASLGKDYKEGKQDDRLLVNMFVEYLKSMPELQGWVLLNYPIDFEQACVLEEFLTGEYVQRYTKQYSDLRREAKMVPTPYKEHKTPLTAFIRTVQKDEFGMDIVLEQLEETDLDKFYSAQGCNYIFNYQTFDEASTKELAKIIVGSTHQIPLKTSLQLFGNLKAKKDDKKGKKDKKDKDSKKSSKSSKKSGKEGKKGKGEKEPIVLQDEEVQVPEPEEVEEIGPFKPGQEGWRYTKLPVPEGETFKNLATLWENVEKTYTDGFKSLFLDKRIILNAIFPYLAKARDEMDAMMAEEDEKQKYITDFQDIFNAIIYDMYASEETGKDDVVQAELLCRVEEFKGKLLEACDKRMNEEENKRKEILGENWAAKQVCELTNLCLTGYQLEIDRFFDSTKIINDFYQSSVTNKPAKSEEIQKLLVKKVDNNKPVNSASIIEKTQETCLNFIGTVSKDSKAIIEKTKKAAKPKKKKAEIFEEDEGITEDLERVWVEWQGALTGEQMRIQYYLDVVKREITELIEDVLRHSTEAFDRIFEKIGEKYEGELREVDKTCTIFSKAANERVVIKPKLLLHQHLSTIDVSLFPPIKPDIDYFETSQLDYISSILMDLWPNGFVPADTFKYFIQDLIDQNRMPKTWSKLKLLDIEKLFAKIFDSNECYQWKDFIINNLQISFPHRERLMNIRDKCRKFDQLFYEVITSEQFDEIKLWFDNEQVKDLLGKLYRTEENSINYTALLLNFCKDHNPIVGFIKALELSLGREICTDPEEGMRFVEAFQNNMIDHETAQKRFQENYDQTVNEIKTIIDDLITEVVDDTLFGVVITEVKEDKVEEEVLEAESEVEVVNEPKFGTEIAYFLPLELLINVLTATLPWNAKVDNVKDLSFREKIEEIYKECKNELFAGVLAHVFLNCDKLQKLFSNIRRFTALNPCIVVHEIVNKDLSL